MPGKLCVFSSGDVEVREREFSIVKAGKALPVEPKAFRVLLHLLRNPQKLIPKEELLNAVWGDTAVSENSLARSIALLRRLLGDESRSPRYIETVATVGYRWVCKVEVSEESPAEADQPEDPPAPANPVSSRKEKTTPSRKRLLAWSLAATLLTLCLAGAAWYFGRPLPPPRITAYAQITHDGRSKKLGGTDGNRLYFSYLSPSSIAQVGVNGGEIAPLPITVPGVDNFLLDLSADGSNALIRVFPDSASLWVVPLLGGPAKRVGYTEGAFSPDGTSVVYSKGAGEVFVVRSDGTEPRKLATVGPIVSGLKWSPDGKAIRYSQGGRLWEVASDGSGVHQTLPGWHEQDDQCCGSWTPDRQFYVFILQSGSTESQIWALDERRGLFRWPPPQPFPLTSGPIRWGAPLPSRDGKKIFADGLTPRGELSRIDPKTGVLQPFLGGISAEFASFSPDGKSVAYVLFPEGTLWKADRDGSHRVQLSGSPVVAINPRWSPNSKHIVFENLNQEAYVVSAEGGSPQRLLPGETARSADPNWSPDGNRIVYEWERLPKRERKLCILDISGRRIDTVSGSTGFFSPRWSADGRYIAALDADAHNLQVFDLEKQLWTTLTSNGDVQFPSFSKDNQFIYFLRSGRDQGVFRISVRGGKQEQVADLRDWHLTGQLGFSMSLDPTDAPLLLRDVGSDDIYALTLEEK